MILYTRGARGQIHQWEITIEDGYLLMSYGVKGGAIQTQKEYVTEGKQGRTVGDQLKTRFWSRIGRMRDRGYVPLDELSDKVTNTLGLPRPMLAKRIQSVSMINWSKAFIQPKFDGHRCMITRHKGEVKAYSRGGKWIESIEHITSGLQIEEGAILDGELYCHGMSLQAISSLVKRKQDDSSMLKYMVYDIVDDLPYHDRLEIIKQIINDTKNDQIEIASTVPVHSKKMALERSMTFRELGYEGGIVRISDKRYEDGVRSNSLIKIKTVQDNNFKIVGIDESREGWGILRCITESGKFFSVSAPGTVDDKYLIARNPDNFVGKTARVEFAYYTPDGIPFHPVAVDIF